jgi:hypothetical protein
VYSRDRIAANLMDPEAVSGPSLYRAAGSPGLSGHSA